MNQDRLTHNVVRGLLLLVIATLLAVNPASLALSVPVEVPPTLPHTSCERDGREQKVKAELGNWPASGSRTISDR